ncbi:hypothetical protein PV729_04325 [Streptomyces europaeiscabiei]|uniref:LigA protein n=1 Tax=Streptomyces europaeiscabiei TaxID=146819 RepID=A0ABU4N7A5_9ACTN|nr:hypothetical protein [Streptomyces europaeiscabiei]MDX3551004.1 hypothetical protein [Streptomyces europaeiscabiei]MDX3698436.1 hypothetical protein [Streptomyces europaeiscabiei]
MGLRIFESDPDAKPAPKVEVQYDKPAFSFRTGMQVFDPKTKRSKPVSLANWRVCTDSEEVAKGIAELYGGSPVDFEPMKEQNWHVLTDTPAVEIVIAGSEAVEDKLIQWGQGGPTHECDGMYSMLPDDKGQPCGCPSTMKERKELARKRPPQGPAPSINIDFTLAGAGEELGKGKLIATAWTLAEVIHEVKDALDAVEGPALCRLEIVPVEYESEIHGRVRYKKPVITVLGSYNDAIAEDRD